MGNANIKNEDLSGSRERIEGVGLCLTQLEEEARHYGLDLTAMLIKAAAMSLGHRNNKT